MCDFMSKSREGDDKKNGKFPIFTICVSCFHFQTQQLLIIHFDLSFLNFYLPKTKTVFVLSTVSHILCRVQCPKFRGSLSLFSLISILTHSYPFLSMDHTLKYHLIIILFFFSYFFVFFCHVQIKFS